MRELTRRQWLRAASAGAATLIGANLLGQTRPAQDRKPNFLIIIGDDHGLMETGCYGNRVVKTPNIDRIAAEGIRMDRAFTTAPMCAPSRSSMYTGLYPVRNGAYPNHSLVWPGTKSLPHYLKPLGYRVALAGKTHIGPKAEFPFEYLNCGPANGKFAQTLDAFLADAKQQPFCLIYASHEPHEPYPPNQGFDPDKVPVPPFLVDTPETREMLTRYYTAIGQLDAEVGKCLELVEKHQLAQDTIVIYVADQGSSYAFAKWTCYEAGLRTPMVARWPGRIKAGSVARAMVSFVDVLPTLVELGGGKPPADIDGKSFAGVLLGRTDQHRDAIFGLQTSRGIIGGPEAYPIRSVRHERYKYIRNLKPDTDFKNVVLNRKKNNYLSSWLRKGGEAAARLRWYEHRPAEELYDLQNDPNELKNLADEPGMHEIKRSLAKLLDEWMKQQKDGGLVTEMEALTRQRKNAGGGEETGD